MKQLKFSYILIILLFLGSCSGKNVTEVPLEAANNIIPRPVKVTYPEKGALILNKETLIMADPVFSQQAAYLKERVREQVGLELPIVSELEEGTSIQLHYDSIGISKPEMYHLEIQDDRVLLKARDVEGIVHGIQSLLQLLPLKKAENIQLPMLSIEDYPRFSYRGMHLDVSRHFFPVEFVKKYIDYLSFHKFNRFHWHLTDDHGWRIEIKSYPKLTEIGAWRDSTIVGHVRDEPRIFDGKRYGGFYTQEEVKDIIDYATVRGITIIPEIDIPGHSRAAIASYPEFSTDPDTTWQVSTAWGTFNKVNNVLAPTPATFEFLEKTFTEVAALFPSPYIHLGGDECSKIWWEADPETQAFIEEHDLKDEEGLQTYIIQQVIETLKEKGKKVIGWDEILQGELDTTAIVMNWRKVEEAVKAAKRGHSIIMTPDAPLYFNYYQDRKKDTLAIFGYNPLDAVYAYEPIPEVIDSLGLEEKILGAQANVWTEYIGYPSTLEYMVFPRMTALSEVLWTPADQKDFSDFKRRLKVTAIPRYEFWDAAYFEDYEMWTIDSKPEKNN